MSFKASLQIKNRKKNQILYLERIVKPFIEYNLINNLKLFNVHSNTIFNYLK